MRFYCIIMKGQKNNFWFCLCHWSKLIGYSNEHLEKHVPLLHTVGCFGGECLILQVRTWWAMPPEKLFLFTTTDRRKLAYRKNELLVLFCTTTATTMFTISLILHYNCNNHVYYTSNQKLFLSLCKTCFSWYFYKRPTWKQKMFTVHQIKNSSFYLKKMFFFIFL